MALSASTLGNLILTNMHAFGAKGKNLPAFCNAVGTGIVMSIVGKSFVTIDTGTVPGHGTGIGTGIMGPQSSVMEEIALSLMPTRGINAPKLMNAIMNATSSHLLDASLITVDTPVFQGSGIVTVGSITVVESEMASNIDSQLFLAQAHGVNRTILARAIAGGVAQQILASGTGNLIITGSPDTSDTYSGSGAGVGTIL